MDFNAYPSHSGSVKSPFNEPSNEDDEFGDFTSAVTFPPAGNHITATSFQPVLPVQTRDNPFNITVPTNSVFFNPIPDCDNDDEFGEFCGPAIASNSSVSSVPGTQSDTFSKLQQETVTKYQPNYDIDLERDLSAVPQLSWMTEEDKDQDEEFTNFTKAELSHDDSFTVSNPLSLTADGILLDPSQPQQNFTPEEPSEHLFAPASVVEFSHFQSPLGQMLEDQKVDDDFGDFTQAVSSPPIVEDLFGLEIQAEPVIVNASIHTEPSVPNSTVLDYLETDEVGSYLSSANELTPHINWDEPFPSLPKDESCISALDSTVENSSDSQPNDAKLIERENTDTKEFLEFEEVEETDVVVSNPVWCRNAEATDIEIESEFQFSSTVHEPVSAFEMNEEIISTEEKVAQDDVDDVEEFGDFTDFQGATEIPAASEDDEFDDFEAAPPVDGSTDSDPPKAQIGTSPESQVQQLLTKLFPVDSLENAPGQEPIIALANSPGGTLWSYVSQLDSTPALSFSWRHSSAHQRFLHSLHVDSINRTGNIAYRWASPASANSSTVSESFTESTVTLDLDFFLNPAATAVGSTTTTADSILETIERELLSPGKDRPPFSTQSPAPVRHNQLSDIFEHLHIDDNTSPATLSSSSTMVPNRQGVVDLLQ